MTNYKTISRLLTTVLLSLASVTAVSTHAAEEATPPQPGAASAYVDDATITAKVKAALLEDQQVQSLSISVTTKKGVVKLSGIVPNAEVGNRALQIASTVPGIKNVESALQLRPPAS
jgi:hyperosmotically inducible periplasmic protein